jgi:hypothetical protein
VREREREREKRLVTTPHTLDVYYTNILVYT